ncbi:hypothetical protein DMP17_24640 [Pseudonocardia sp. TMWB2A]|uniref:hypothetical protein n=1 Tax=Pseudonocardia sp. TMWB2A TaxID=687430 RepID=UPI00307EBF69
MTDSHLARLSEIADDDHRHFTRPTGRPEYRDRRVAVVLAQGGALHAIDETTGVKDLDVWTFYATIPGVAFRFGQRKRQVDFGSSSLSRNLYPPAFEHPQLRRWLTFAGRRVDLMIRSLPVPEDAPYDAVAEALRQWLRKGAVMRQRNSDDDMPSNWWLAQKAMLTIDPEHARRSIVWPPG